MTCPRCEGKVGVIDNTSNPNTNENYRLRKCLECGKKFYTIEMEVETNKEFLDLWYRNHRHEAYRAKHK